jgi:hypothetical protein
VHELVSGRADDHLHGIALDVAHRPADVPDDRRVRRDGVAEDDGRGPQRACRTLERRSSVDRPICRRPSCPGWPPNRSG